MKYKEHIPEQLFTEEGHYLGKPAEFDDRIVQRRIRLVREIPGFVGSELTLLDIGCGNGASLFALSPYMKHCVGIDICDDHLPEFNAFMTENKIINCEHQIIDIENNSPTQTFDRIISFEVIEHLSSEDGVAYFYNALKEGGLVAISVPNKWWIFETHGAKLPLLPWNRVPFFSWLPKKIHEKYANARIYSKKRITKLLKNHGFTVISSQYITAPMDVLPKGKFKNFVIRHFFNNDTTKIPFKATSIFIVCKK